MTIEANFVRKRSGKTMTDELVSTAGLAATAFMPFVGMSAARADVEGRAPDQVGF
jgi:hypothetical protein